MFYNQDNLKGRIQNAKRKLQLSFQNFKRSELVKSFHDYPLVTMVHIEYRLNITHLCTRFTGFLRLLGLQSSPLQYKLHCSGIVCKPEESEKPLYQC